MFFINKFGYLLNTTSDLTMTGDGYLLFDENRNPFVENIKRENEKTTHLDYVRPIFNNLEYYFTKIISETIQRKIDSFKNDQQSDFKYYPIF